MTGRHRLRTIAVRLLLASSSQSLLAACSDTAGVREPTIAELAISPESASLSGVGATAQLTATATDLAGDTIPSIEVSWSSLNPYIAEIDPTSGIATAVASGQVTVAAEAAGLVAYGLLTVSVPDLPPVTSWIPMTLGFAATDVWGASSTDVFFVGGGSGGADIAHYDGTSWSPMDAAGADRTLWGIWGISGNEVFAVGDGGIVLHYDGTSWSPMDSGVSGSLTGLWGAAPNAVFAVGSAGAHFYDGQSWSPVSEVEGGPWWVWGTSTEDVHFGGVDVTRGVWGTSPADLFAVGRLGRIWHYDGVSWTLMESGTDKFLTGVWGTSPSDVYAVGDEGTILHYDGSSWSPMESGTDLELWQIWGISSGDVFVVSRYGLVLRGVR